MFLLFTADEQEMLAIQMSWLFVALLISCSCWGLLEQIVAAVGIAVVARGFAGDDLMARQIVATALPASVMVSVDVARTATFCGSSKR